MEDATLGMAGANQTWFNSCRALLRNPSTAFPRIRDTCHSPQIHPCAPSTSLDDAKTWRYEQDTTTRMAPESSHHMEDLLEVRAGQEALASSAILLWVSFKSSCVLSPCLLIGECVAVIVVLRTFPRASILDTIRDIHYPPSAHTCARSNPLQDTKAWK